MTAYSRSFSRWQAAGIHLLVSAAIAAIFLFVTLALWYPSPFFTAEGGNNLLLILIGVDVLIGPLITLIIFRSGKAGLRFDLTVIGLLQACALAYGAHVMFVARPVYVAFMDDQFETVRANDLDPASIEKASRPEFRSTPLTGPKYVVVELPKDLKALNELIAHAAAGGQPPQHLPQYYVPYSEAKAAVQEKSRPLNLLRDANQAVAARIDKALAETGYKSSDLNFLRLETRSGGGVVLIDAKTGDIVRVLPPGVLF